MQQSFQGKSAQRRACLGTVGFLVSVMLVAMVPSLTAAEDDDDTWMKSSLSGTYTDQQFVTGERVEVNNANVSDDIFAAGNDLKFDTVTAEMIVAAGASLWFRDITVDDLMLAAGASLWFSNIKADDVIFAAGATLRFEDITAEDLILAGGQLSFSGQVEDDLIAAVCPFCPIHGRLHLTKRTRIGDDARLAGREVIIDGRIGGNLYAAGQRVELSGEVAGNAAVEAKRIILDSTARIAGDLRYASPNEPELRDGAVVAGRILRVEPRIAFDKETPEHPVWIAVFAVLGLLLALVVLGVALQLAIPGILAGAAAASSTAVWACLGRGLVLALLGPAAAALLIATVIGAPVGILIIAALVLLYAMAFVAISYSIGLMVRRRFGKSESVASAGPRILWTAVGILLLAIIGLVPLIGQVTGLLAIICGLGAVISQLGLVFRPASAAAAST